MLYFLFIFLFITIVISIDEQYLKFPVQFSANITITAHQVPTESIYPPRIRTIAVYYDYFAKKVRADLSSGYEAEKTYIRRYDIKKEYMIRNPPISDCKRSYLGELFPYPLITESKYIHNNIDINGTLCNYYLIEEIGQRIHIYMSMSNNAPVRLIEESYDGYESKEMLTYDYNNVILGPQEDSVFELPQMYTHDECVSHAGGFPYLHIFHHYVRF